MAEVAHAKHPESQACCAREFQGVFAGDGPGDESGSDNTVKELAMVWTGRGFQDVRAETEESPCAGAEEEFAPIKWSVVVHRHLGGLDEDVDGRADNCAGYEMCFSVWHNHFRLNKKS